MADTVELVTGATVEGRFGIARGKAKDLAAVGLITVRGKAGSRNLYSLHEVRSVMERPWVQPPHGSAFVVKVNAAGWDPEASSEDKVSMVAGWWPCADPDAYVGRPMLVAHQSFILAAYRITGYETGYGRRRFDLEQPGRESAPFLLSADPVVGRRLPAQRGPISYGLESED
ncbi:hypothetical protein [Naumannella halotolerans]|uniref:Uncharacterized protein n=1 Tax=Naumannella halotolerans TaxID=993414 RepID=A0A4R7J2M6_9ACTN|nr:hypothetical protein [Naumannella halotolerans]TDT31344.1 hypothetical protein CLV29_2763 [Naumannella halotolerans]